MKRFLWLAVVLLGLGCRGGRCSETPHTPSLTTFAARLADETVALVDLDTADHPQLYCSAVWVSRRCILTAEHCVADLGEPPIQKLMHAWGLSDGSKRWDPTGQVASYATKDGLPRDADRTVRTMAARVVEDDYAHDLALLMADESRLPDHPVAKLGHDVVAGDLVMGMGHPGRYQWSFALGYVSAIRPLEPNFDDVQIDTLQVQIPISGGNSGGGLYDAQGDLVGIASYRNGGASGMGFYVGLDPIRVLLKGSGCGQEL
jgi:S1-C subfamily serine protease